jgi:hypothetical protein
MGENQREIGVPVKSTFLEGRSELGWPCNGESEDRFVVVNAHFQAKFIELVLSDQACGLPSKRSDSLNVHRAFVLLLHGDSPSCLAESQECRSAVGKASTVTVGKGRSGLECE